MSDIERPLDPDDIRMRPQPGQDLEAEPDDPGRPPDDEDIEAPRAQ